MQTKEELKYQITDSIKTVYSLALVIAWAWISLIKQMVKLTGIAIMLFTPLMLYNAWLLKSIALTLTAIAFMFVGSFIYLKK
jgi:uncharacterized Tic20 family protein